MTELLSYSSLKNTHQMREYEEKKMHERKRNLLYLIAHYLKDEGYYDSVATFANEAQLTSAYKICDNIDLLLIFQDFESYYYIRFQKYPKICKKSNNEESLLSVNKRAVKIQSKKPGSEINTVLKSTVKSQNAIKIPATTKKLPDTNCLSVTQLGNRSEAEHVEENCGRTLKPLQGMGVHNPEWSQMAEMITRDIVLQDLKVKWSDIMGLDEAKRLLKEAVIYPIKYPELFTGILTPWKGLLLFGPPGTGKTLLAKAVATECKTTFFNITSSSIVSKWRGDSEKLVRVMFDLARYYAPSTIFLDELDALVSKRDGINQTGEHEGSRRLKTELLIQLDGLSQGDDQVFFLATSNLPWDLDPSMLRRLEKKILVGLPNTAARQAMFKHYLPETVLKQPLLKCDICYETLAEKTEGYSGSDIQVACKETAMQSLRQIFQVLENAGNNSTCPQLPPTKLELKTITTADVQTALAKTKPSASHLNQRYKLWQEQFGSV